MKTILTRFMAYIPCHYSNLVSSIVSPASIASTTSCISTSPISSTLIVPLVLSMMLATPTAYASKEEEFKKYLDQAGAFKDNVSKSTAGFAPDKVFDNYSSNPQTTKYYSEDNAGASQTIKSDGIVKVASDNEGKAVAESSQSRVKFKINPESEEMKKGKEIQKAANSKTGISDEFLGNEDTQVNTEHTKYVIKTCNEEIRPLKRVCDKTPHVTVTPQEALYPNCRHMVVTQDAFVYCPSGYSELYYSDMIWGVTWDDIRLCTKPVYSKESCECYIGHLVHGIYDRAPSVNSTGTAVVPKRFHGRVRFSNVYHGNMVVTIVNDTTGETLYNSGSFSSGQVIQLPYSETKDQTFRFYVPTVTYSGFWFFGGGGTHYAGGIGVMTVYADQVGSENVAKVEWKEVCHDI